ncbi:glycosylated lysosomal membrane protein [Anabrus simplex]|uniref:glycosylated lysosomal membrane protein n=1 Tax=Anabrus simplex TaxID=316456 RepID=UPI0034DCE1C5
MFVSLRCVSRCILIIMFMLVLSSSCLERKITSELNPGCDSHISKNLSFSVVYVKAEGSNDTLHYLWDLSRKPSVLLALTPPGSRVEFNCTEFGMENALRFDVPVKYSFAIVINKIWEYNDVNDTGTLDLENKSDNYVRELDPSNFSWKRVEYKNDSKSVILGIESLLYHDNNTYKNGTLKIELSGFGYEDHSDLLPHLLHTANSTQVDLVIDGLTTESTFTSSRFAVEIVMISSDGTNSSMKINARKSLDDEHTPGVFTLVDVETPSSSSASAGGYLQWRPVAYISKNRDISNSTDTDIYGVSNVKNASSYLANSLLAHSFYDLDHQNLLMQSAVVSFGIKEDGFYKKTNYTSWTFTVGYGKPPDEDFSLLVILVISIGLGLPALLIIISGIIMFVRRISHKKDDLFLSR